MAVQSWRDNPKAVAFMEERARVKDQMRAMRTSAALRRAAPNPAKAAKVLAAMDDQAIAFAAQNMDHSPSGRALALAALEERQGKVGAAQTVDDFIDSLPPCPWLAPGDLERDDSVFFGWGRWLRRTLGALAFLSIAPWIVMVVLSQAELDRATAAALAGGAFSEQELQAAQAFDALPLEEREKLRPSQAGEVSLSEMEKLRSRETSQPFFARHRQLDEWFGHSLLGALVLAPLWTVVTAARRKPARILLLRRFNNAKIGQAINRLSERHLRPYGHIYTLADKFFKRSYIGAVLSVWSFNPIVFLWRIINVPFALLRRLFDRTRAGPIMIWSARDFRHFVRRLTDRWGLNLEVLRTKRNAVMVRTSDAWWQHVVVLLMHAADAIVIDVTEVSSGTAWELHNLRDEAVADRAVFIARSDQETHARAACAANGFPEVTLHLYAANGRLADERAFRTAMRAAMLTRLKALAV